jgi:hypothetical protein
MEVADWARPAVGSLSLRAMLVHRGGLTQSID